jgi:hypothetical protein
LTLIFSKPYNTLFHFLAEATAVSSGQTHLKKLASVAGFRRKTDDFQPVATQKIGL